MEDFEMIRLYEEKVLKPFMEKHGCSKEEAIKKTYYRMDYEL